MPRSLDDWPDIQILPLDCFDTLLWHDTHAPGDGAMLNRLRNYRKIIEWQNNAP